MYHRYASQ
ncbi:hypothetical protein E2C01_068819 [Portunus trituberculatus]|uniref:Uncharacterized protein n=1 Tax=Portunus trituberculatus TaxID=210409 RepID=A0A5B7HPU3_PORTR|nr:hypothetical protein [Portunus trituberculatus]